MIPRSFSSEFCKTVNLFGSIFLNESFTGHFDLQIEQMNAWYHMPKKMYMIKEFSPLDKIKVSEFQRTPKNEITTKNGTFNCQ